MTLKWVKDGEWWSMRKRLTADELREMAQSLVARSEELEATARAQAESLRLLNDALRAHLDAVKRGER